MSGPLSVHNAEIKTASVEIRTLTISGKQVTLAVYRQLRNEPLIVMPERDVILRGVPWGTVNYHPGKCGNERHLHVIWQRSRELLRARVMAPETVWSDRARNAPEGSDAHRNFSQYRALWDDLSDLPQLFIAV